MSTPPPVPSQGHITYAGFWKRFIATIIDGFISGIVNFALLVPCLAILGLPGSQARPPARLIQWRRRTQLP